MEFITTKNLMQHNKHARTTAPETISAKMSDKLSSVAVNEIKVMNHNVLVALQNFYKVKIIVLGLLRSQYRRY